MFENYFFEQVMFLGYIYKCSNLVELKIIKRDTNAWIES